MHARSCAETVILRLFLSVRCKIFDLPRRGRTELLDLQKQRDRTKEKETVDAAPTSWNQVSLYNLGFALTLHSKYTSEPSLMSLGFKVEPIFRLAIGATAIRIKKNRIKCLACVSNRWSTHCSHRDCENAMYRTIVFDV